MKTKTSSGLEFISSGISNKESGKVRVIYIYIYIKGIKFNTFSSNKTDNHPSLKGAVVNQDEGSLEITSTLYSPFKICLFVQVSGSFEGKYELKDYKALISTKWSTSNILSSKFEFQV